MSLSIGKCYQVYLNDGTIGSLEDNESKTLLVKRAFMNYSYGSATAQIKSESIIDFNKIIISKQNGGFTILFNRDDETLKSYTDADFVYGTYRNHRLLITFELTGIINNFEMETFDTYCSEITSGKINLKISNSSIKFNFNTYTSNAIVNVIMGLVETLTFEYSANDGYVYTSNPIITIVSPVTYLQNARINLTNLVKFENGIISIPFIVPLSSDGTTPYYVEINFSPVVKSQLTITNLSTIFTIDSESPYVEQVYLTDNSLLKNWECENGYHFDNTSINKIKEYFKHGGRTYVGFKDLLVESQVDGTLNVRFMHVTSNLTIPNTITHDDFGMIDNPRITTELTGVTVDITSGQQFDYYSQVTINIGIIAGYNAENKKIHIYRGEDEITQDCTVSDTQIIIPHITDDLKVSIVAKHYVTLIIKDENDNTLLTTNTNDIIKNVRFRHVGQNVYDFKIASQSHMFLFNLPSGKQIVGIGQNEIIFYLNVTVKSIDLSQYGFSTVTFTLYVKDEEITPTSFTLKKYEMKCEKNVVDKTNFITSVGDLTGTLRESCSITNPIITFESSDVPSFNYVYIPNFNRYYFVNEIVSISKNMWQMSLKVDVLMSFKEQIKSQTCVIARNEFDFDNLIEDVERKKLSGTINEVIDITYEDNIFDGNTWDKYNEENSCFVLEIMGGR